MKSFILLMCLFCASCADCNNKEYTQEEVCRMYRPDAGDNHCKPPPIDHSNDYYYWIW